MRTNGFESKLSALTVGLLLLAGAGSAVAQEAQEQQQQPTQQQEQAAPQAEQAAPDSEPAKGFSLVLDPLVIGAIDTDVDTNSSKFQEYRDLSSGPILGFNLLGEGDGDRVLSLNVANARRDDARYTLNYGVLGRYNILFDYNKIPHRFGNRGHMIYTRTGPGTYSIADPTQAALQGALTNQFTTNPAGINYNFLNNLLTPYLNTAQSVDLALERDRTLARMDLGRMGRLAWGLEYTHENRTGNRPYGASFGFSNATELPEPIDYDTTGAEIAGEWNSDTAGFKLGYRHSDFKNNISTMYWDNPWRLTSATDPSAYSSPGAGSIGGSAVGFADLAPDNQSNVLFAAGRTRFAGNWFFNGTASYNQMKQDDDLLPYTLNSAIVGINFNGSKFNPTDPANLPVRSADRKVDVTNLTAQLGTRFAERFGLTFHYRYYDYDNASHEIEFPGYVRYHAVWEAIARVTAPYSYTRQNAGAEIGWDFGLNSRLALLYDHETWDRELREVDSTDEDIFKLSYDTHPTQRFSLHGSYEHGDRSISAYHPEAAEVTFAEPEGVTNIPTLRKFDEAARTFDGFNVLAQFFATDAWNLTLGANSRNEDYDKSAFGLQKDDILSYNAEISYTPGENVSFFLFGQRADRDVQQKARQSGATPSTNPLDDWTAKFNEVTDTWGLGLNSRFATRWLFDAQANYSKSDGEADLFSPPGGTPDRAVGFDNYEDIKLTSIFGRLGYKISPNATASLFGRWEDYTLDSFIYQGLRNYLPGALLLNPNLGDYTGRVLGVDLSLTIP